MTWVLGISGSHNGAYCLLHDGRIHVAIQEERLTGLKRDRVYGGRHALGLRYCLDAAGISVSDLAMVVLASQNSAAEEENDLSLHPGLRGDASFARRVVSHHLGHAASAFATSGLDEAAVVVCDGMGSPVLDLREDSRAVVRDAECSGSEHLSVYSAHGTRLTPIEVHTTTEWFARQGPGMPRFGSLGGMFAAAAQQIFGDATEAGKVMGLAPYGKPVIPADEFVVCREGALVFPNRVQARFEREALWPDQGAENADLAASVQRALDLAVLSVVQRARAQTGLRRLCLAGGVALNCVTNQLLHEQSGFDEIHIVPAAEDSGVAIGAAFLGWWELGGSAGRARISMDGLGRAAASEQVDAAIAAMPDLRCAETSDLIGDATERLTAGEIGGWFQGGAEFGPRALGHRSILASPCLPDAKDRLNTRVKFRETFRPFAPAVLADKASEWFDFGATSIDSPFMLRVVPIRSDKQQLIPAVTHVDGTGRVQTVEKRDHPRLSALIARFGARTGVPILVNTSFNVRNEPLVETPEDALWLLLGTGLDFCVIEDRLVVRAPEFRSLLHYRPRVIAREFALRLDVRDGRLAGSLQREDDVHCVTRTPWGEARFTLPLRLMPILAAIDGSRDGHAIMAEMGLEDHQRFVHDLLLLRRMRVIALERP